MKTSSQETNNKRIEFILTGFGAFGKHLKNPTSILIENILKNKSEFEIPELYKIGDCEVLFVAAEDCEEFYEKTMKDLERKRVEDKETIYIIVHFGLYSGCKEFHLELLGHNCADFRIPDNRKNQFSNKPIIAKYPLEHYFRTMIPIISIQSNLEKNGYKTKLSDDPGRFICNYIYYLSLFYGYKADVPSLFVHFPDFNDMAEKIQINFVKSLLHMIALEYNKQ